MQRLARLRELLASLVAQYVYVYVQAPDLLLGLSLTLSQAGKLLGVQSGLLFDHAKALAKAGYRVLHTIVPLYEPDK
ncbi:MAG: hypothetical protein HC893_00115 [Chloroflexaceae bacterium]|nr:hypothetical protein [Chloroflexaceae bacterium]